MPGFSAAIAPFPGCERWRRAAECVRPIHPRPSGEMPQRTIGSASATSTPKQPADCHTFGVADAQGRGLHARPAVVEARVILTASTWRCSTRQPASGEDSLGCPRSQDSALRRQRDSRKPWKDYETLRQAVALVAERLKARLFSSWQWARMHPSATGRAECASYFPAEPHGRGALLPIRGPIRSRRARRHFSEHDSRSYSLWHASRGYSRGRNPGAGEGSRHPGSVGGDSGRAFGPDEATGVLVQTGTPRVWQRPSCLS